MKGEFVVFLIGMRINKPWKVRKWVPVFLTMPRMIKELEANPDSGFLGRVGKLVPASGRKDEARGRLQSQSASGFPDEA